MGVGSAIGVVLDEVGDPAPLAAVVTALVAVVIGLSGLAAGILARSSPSRQSVVIEGSSVVA